MQGLIPEIPRMERHVTAKPHWPLCVRPYGYSYECPECGEKYFDETRDIGVVPRGGHRSEFICPGCATNIVITYKYETIQL